MADPLIPTSRRFSKAARAERDRVRKRREQLLTRRQRLQENLDDLERELTAADRQISVLEQLTTAEATESQPLASDPGQGTSRILTGSTIREVAIPLLLREHGASPIHYRAWHELLDRAGYAVNGKRPEAVFLNQVARSPLVRATTTSGYYAIDAAVVGQLRERLIRQQHELADAALPESPGEFESHRESQRERKLAIAKTERELDEAVAALNAAGLTAES